MEWIRLPTTCNLTKKNKWFFIVLLFNNTFMRLLTKAIEKKFEKYPLYSQDGVPAKDKYVICKFFNPCGSGTWYVTEAEKTEDGDWLFFGLVDLHETEWGEFTLSQLKSVRLPYGLTIERDRYFNNKFDSEILNKI